MFLESRPNLNGWKSHTLTPRYRRLEKSHYERESYINWVLVVEGGLWVRGDEGIPLDTGTHKSEGAVEVVDDLDNLVDPD